MTLEETAADLVQAVVPYDGRFLLVEGPGGWELPSGSPEPAEMATATAARVVYELTGYLVDGSQVLRPNDEGIPAVVCQLLSEDPSEGGSLTREQLRWASVHEVSESELPRAVRDFLRGHSPT
ncbi:NUDIX hydrolase [Streptomyces sp. NPDC048441]|uniref:NUDIX hydrolase n=1 Tax=Streptomyces sp. NPDC048441 TaxID=3365552 RepID=UPI00371A7233